MMCYIVTALVTLPGALLSIQASATVMLHRGIGVRTLACPSICLTYLRDVLKPPVEPEWRKENEVCYHREKMAHCVNDIPQRATRTLHFCADIPSLVGGLLPKIWQTLWCFHRVWQRTHTGGLQSSCQATLTSPLLQITLNPHLSFASRVYKPPLSSQVFLFLPCALWSEGATASCLWTIGVTWQMEGPVGDCRWIFSSFGSPGLQVESDYSN